MSEILVHTQDVQFEVETKDSTLSTHTNRRIYYIKPANDGTKGALADALFVAGTAAAGADGDSVNRGASINFDKVGVWVWWSESDNPSGRHCVSPAFEALVQERGVVRR